MGVIRNQRIKIHRISTLSYPQGLIDDVNSSQLGEARAYTVAHFALREALLDALLDARSIIGCAAWHSNASRYNLRTLTQEFSQNLGERFSGSVRGRK